MSISIIQGISRKEIGVGVGKLQITTKEIIVS